MSFINWGHETPEQRAVRRRLEEQALIQQAMTKKIFEQRAAAPASAASAGAAGSGGKTLGLNVGAAHTAIYAPSELEGGNYSIWIVNPESKTQEFLIDTGFPTGDKYDIIPVQNGGSMYILRQGFGAAASYTYKLVYYQIDGTLIYEEVFTDVLEDYWYSLGAKGGYVIMDNNLVLFFEDQVTKMELGFSTDIYEYTANGYTAEGSMFISYSDSPGTMSLRQYNIDGSSNHIGTFPDFQLYTYSAYESEDYWNSDAEVLGSTIILLSNDGTIFRLINHDGSTRVDLRQQIITEFGYDVANSDYVNNSFGFGSAQINPTDIANIRFVFQFANYDNSTKHLFLINGDTGFYYGFESETQPEIAMGDYYNILSNSFVFYLPANLVNSSPVTVRSGFQKPLNENGYDVYFVNSIGEQSNFNLQTKLNGGAYILMEDETGPYVLWPWINIIAKTPNPLYQYKLARLNQESNSTEQTFNDLTADENTAFLSMQAAISKNGYKKVVISFNKSGEGLLWHVVNPNSSLQLVNVLEGVPDEYNPYGYTYMPPLASNGQFVIPFGYGTGSEVGLCAFDINNVNDPEGVTVVPTTGIIMPADTTTKSTEYATGTKANFSNNGCLVYLQEQPTQGNNYNFCFVDNNSNVYGDSYYQQSSYGFQLFPDVLYVGTGANTTEVRSTADYSLLKELSVPIPPNSTSLIFGTPSDVLIILTKEGNLHPFDLPLNYDYYRMVNDIDWYNN